MQTALEVARGLEYLHHSDRRLVHRDLSTNNVLLVTDGNERGFRALLSDFGQSYAREKKHFALWCLAELSWSATAIMVFA